MFRESVKQETSQATSKLSFAERAHLAPHPLTKRLCALMEQKQTNLAVAADVTTTAELLHLTKTLGPHICILKTHVDILSDFTPTSVKTLRQLADEQGFLLFEDRKFADIGNTVLHQYEGGIYRIAEWAHITNAHPLPGPGVIEGLAKVGVPKGNGLLLLAEMSSKGTLISQEYTQKTIEMAKKHPDFVMGFICQQKLTEDSNFLHLTPGIQKKGSGDGFGQQYNTPEHAITERGSDIIIVGRGITQATNPKEAAISYQQAGWEAYEKKSLCKNQQ